MRTRTASRRSNRVFRLLDVRRRRRNTGPPGKFVGNNGPGTPLARGHGQEADAKRRADAILAESLLDGARSACRRVRAAWRDLWR
jgi:hypothetical protein